MPAERVKVSMRPGGSHIGGRPKRGPPAGPVCEEMGCKRRIAGRFRRFLSKEGTT